MGLFFVALGYHSGRQWCRQDLVDEPVCEQDIQCSVQGNHWRRFPHQRGHDRRQTSDHADLGYSWPGEIPVTGSRFLQRRRLLCARV